jgi:hypothetical protein
MRRMRMRNLGKPGFTDPARETELPQPEDGT